MHDRQSAACRPWLSLLFLSLSLLTPSAWPLQNQLKDHASPYLALHGDDPVAWQDWDPSILKLAQQQDKLIFISSGYFSCHWCHVMQRESYSDPGIAAFLNEHFIPVKVDRELNPALDAYLIDYLERTQGHAGWPLNLFLTPEGYPLVGASYLAPKRFLAVLRRLQGTWDEQRGQVRDLARRALLELTADRPQPQGESAAPEKLRQRFVDQALAFADPMEGGFGAQNKFPMTPQLEALARIRAGRSGDDLDHLLRLTLDQMAHQGLRDQLGGGFFRYTVDPSWHVPHFEKMLYTQALLTRVYLRAGSLYGDPEYLRVARDTLDFVLRGMRGPQGMFVASFSAVDEEGREGAYYLWSAGELDRLLGKAGARLARRHWAMLGPQSMDDGYLPRHGEEAEQLAASLGEKPAVVTKWLAVARDRLLQHRAERSLPADTKELAGWNGLLVGTLALAGRQLQEPAYLGEARRLAGLIKTRLWHDGELWRARAGDRPVGQAGLGDYAYLAQGLGDLLKAADDPELSTWRRQLVDAAWQRFHDRRGWRPAETPPLPGMGATKAVRDGALPAPPALLIEAALESGDETLQAEGAEARQQALVELAEEPFWYPSYLAAKAE
jgi:uncharacterized protein YyaL (SSP411 family)